MESNGDSQNISGLSWEELLNPRSRENTVSGLAESKEKILLGIKISRHHADRIKQYYTSWIQSSERAFFFSSLVILACLSDVKIKLLVGTGFACAYPFFESCMHRLLSAIAIIDIAVNEHQYVNILFGNVQPVREYYPFQKESKVSFYRAELKPFLQECASLSRDLVKKIGNEFLPREDNTGSRSAVSPEQPTASDPETVLRDRHAFYYARDTNPNLLHDPIRTTPPAGSLSWRQRLLIPVMYVLIPVVLMVSVILNIWLGLGILSLFNIVIMQIHLRGVEAQRRPSTEGASHLEPSKSVPLRFRGPDLSQPGAGESAGLRSESERRKPAV